MRKGSGHNQAGFTLLEVMVALAIIAMVLVVMLGLVQRNILTNERLQKMTRATLLAKQKMAEVENKMIPADQIQGTFDEPNQEFTWHIVYTPTPITGIQQIDLSVIWGAEKENEQVTLISFLK